MKGITKEFPGVKALDNVTFNAYPGEILALCGENGAGKSTLMKVLSGVYGEGTYEGEIYVNGQLCHFTDPSKSVHAGIAMIYLEISMHLDMSIAENIYIGAWPKKGGRVDWAGMNRETVGLLKRVGLDMAPDTILRRLSASQQQLVSIARALSKNPRILVLDEPTSSLTEDEVEHLFRIMKRLTAKGVGIIYISHKMDEILRISDDVTIMRDGQWVATKPAKDLDTNEIIRLMVNREMTNRFPPKNNHPGEVLLDVKNVSGMYEPTCHDVSFQLHAGEVLGVAGLVGSRRTELLNTLFGYFTKGGGEVTMRGRKIENATTDEARNNGFALITEERRATGIFGEASILFNSIIANVNAYGKPLLNSRKMDKDTDWVIDSIAVKTPSKRTHIKSLSGGNQQKVIIGRWLLTKPDVLLLDEPTRGIDVGSKYEIYQLILDLAEQGKGVMMVSSEMPELLGICDRILVMSNGRLAGTVVRGVDFGGIAGEQETIMALAAKYV